MELHPCSTTEVKTKNALPLTSGFTQAGVQTRLTQSR